MNPYYTDEKVIIYWGDCLEVMKIFSDKSFDMILCDLSHRMTACKWDAIIPLDPLWEQYKRIIKDNGVIVLIAPQPFASMLVMSNLKMFRHEWIWEKHQSTNPISPLKSHENILVFSKNKVLYNPLWKLASYIRDLILTRNKTKFMEGNKSIHGDNKKSSRYPKTVIRITKDKGEAIQKPVTLFEYLIKIYTNEGGMVLDNCMGSGTTLVAAKRLERKAVGIEILEEYCAIAKKRLTQEMLS